MLAGACKADAIGVWETDSGAPLASSGIDGGITIRERDMIVMIRFGDHLLGVSLTQFERSRTGMIGLTGAATASSGRPTQRSYAAL